MTTSFSKLQVRLTDLLRRSEEVDEFWETRVTELENTIKETVNNTRLLTHQNVELEHRIAQQKPEMDNAIDARMASILRLSNAYRVIVDLANKVYYC
jgi:DNA-binding transcriptional regulator GbsR (MarR family)